MTRHMQPPSFDIAEQTGLICRQLFNLALRMQNDKAEPEIAQKVLGLRDALVQTMGGYTRSGEGI